MDEGARQLRTFHRLVANGLGANVTNNFLWFALTFWVYLETRSVIATSVIGGGYMLLLAASGLAFGTFVDRHRRKAAMLLSSALSLGAYVAAGAVYVAAPAGALRDPADPRLWVLVTLVLAGAIAGNLRIVALTTTVTLLVPEGRHDRANGLIGTVSGVGFALTSVFSGLAIGRLGMGWSLALGVALTAATAVHLLGIRVDEPAPEPAAAGAAAVDLRGALRAVRAVDGLVALLAFTTINNFLGGTFMALMDPYGLSLTSVETWGLLWGVVSLGFIAGGVAVARRGLGANPVRTLLLANLVLWTACAVFPLRSSIVLLAVGMLAFMALMPVAEASEQTVIQRVVPFGEQGRVFGLAQSVETAASPVTAFLLGPIAQLWVMPFMTDGAGARAIGGWFGTGPDRGIALVFVVAGLVGLALTALALRSRAAARLSARYAAAAPAAQAPPEPAMAGSAAGTGQAFT
jgi:DHA3 family multidrug efflux protein-like MFS transporter